MGRRGPKAKPTATAKRDGTYRADRRRGEPEAEVELPPEPEWLGEKARKCWAEIAPWLTRAKLLTRLDQVALALLCDSLGEYLLAREVVNQAAIETGVRFVSVTDSGNVIQHPAVGVANRKWEQVTKLLREFGMTPSARAGLHVGGDEPEDDLLALITKQYAAEN
jgi:P27 family predicted phage terminase small subunit